MELTVDCNRSAFSLVVESLERDNRGSLAVSDKTIHWLTVVAYVARKKSKSHKSAA
jgi:hypothetical protein